MKNNRLNFSHLLDSAKAYRMNPEAAVKTMTDLLKNPGSFQTKQTGEIVGAVATTAVEFAKLGFDVTKFVIGELQANSFEAESGNLRVIGNGDNSLTSYINSHADKSDTIQFKMIDVSPVPKWDSCATRIFGKCVGGLKIKPLNATIMDVIVRLDGACDAKHVQYGGHFIPSAVFKVERNQQKYPGMNGTIKLLQEDPINVGSQDSLNPYFRLHLNFDARFLNIKWDGVLSNNMQQTMTLVGRDPRSIHCFFNYDRSQDQFK